MEGPQTGNGGLGHLRAVVEKSGRYRLGVVVNLGFVGNCCAHGEFVAASLKSEPGAELVAGWESDTMHQLRLVAAMGMALPLGDTADLPV